eukprot:14666865-Heterocapsa_arctica.AAC.1
MPFIFFATVEVKQIKYVDDVADVVALRLYLECGNEQSARLFGHIKEQMDKKTGTREKLLGTIKTRTKAAIIESILGLGCISSRKATKN